MLSRIAESLFWIGRYMERSDWTARTIEVHLRMRMDDPWIPESDSCRTLLALMGVSEEEVDGEIGHHEVLRLLGYDPASPSSIAASFGQARENARRAREVIPASLWEVINKTWQQMPQQPVTFARSQGYLAWARERSSLFTGVARQAMVRDEGWQFLLLGRSLEQVDMMSRLLATGAGPTPTPWPAILRGAGAYDAFLRTYRGFRADQEAAEFLLLDSRLPRSIMHGLDSAQHCLQGLRRAEAGISNQESDALRVLGRLRAHIYYTDIAQLMDDLGAEMADIQTGCDEVTQAITRDFFAALEVSAWTTEGIL